MPEHTLSLYDMFLQAGLIGKGVMVLLSLASVWCLAIILEALWMLLRLRRALTSGRGASAAALNAVFEAGQSEAALILPDETVSERRGRVVALMKRRAQELIEHAQGGLANLAVIASVAPFLGLFGTVWGIMTSFTGIAASKDTSLAVVAPGIAEALAATAIGLAAAIPAAFAYNRLKSAFSHLSRQLNRLIEDEATGVLRKAETRAARPVEVRS